MIAHHTCGSTFFLRSQTRWIIGIETTQTRKREMSPLRLAASDAKNIAGQIEP